MTRVDAYAKRREKSLWFNEEEFDANESCLLAMSLQEFCANHSVGQSKNQRNKIKIEPKKNKVVVFFPDLSSSPDSATFVDYCKYALMKYKPWETTPDNLWGGKDAKKEDMHY